MSKRLMLFLIANFLLAIFVGINFFTKATVPKVAVPVGAASPLNNIKQATTIGQQLGAAPVVANPPTVVAPTIVTDKPAVTNSPTVVTDKPAVPNPPAVIAKAPTVVTAQPVVVTPPAATQPTVVSNAPKAMINSNPAEPVTPFIAPTEHEGVCVIYGPVAVNSKGIVDTLLEKAHVLDSAEVFNKPVYEIYWNLGSKKSVATELFNKQKNGGALQADNFQLKQDKSGEWIVPIAEITADEKNAYNTTRDLGEKANRSNTGGKWQYRVSENVYFYQFSNSAAIPREVQAVLDKTFAVPKAKC